MPIGFPLSNVLRMRIDVLLLLLLLVTSPAFAQRTSQGGGGGGGGGGLNTNAAGATTQVQYNNAGVFDGAAGILVIASSSETNLTVLGNIRAYQLIASNAVDALGWLTVAGPQTNAGIIVLNGASTFNAAAAFLNTATFSGSSVTIAGRTIINTNLLMGTVPSAPTPTAGRAALYSKDDGGVAKLYAKWDDGTEVGPLGAGGVGTPGGSTTQLQYNDGGSFNGMSGWVTSTGETNLFGSGILYAWRMAATNQLEVLGDFSIPARIYMYESNKVDYILETVPNVISAISTNVIHPQTASGFKYGTNNGAGLNDIGTIAGTGSGSVVQANGATLGSTTIITNLTVGNNITFSNQLNGVGTNNAAIRLAGTNTGWIEIVAPTTGQSNSVTPHIIGAAVGDVLGLVHSVTVQAGTNAIVATNVTTSGSGSVIRANGSTIGSATITSNLIYTSALLVPQSQLTNHTADFAFTDRSYLLTNNFHVSAIANGGASTNVRYLTIKLENLSGSTKIVSLGSTIKRSGTNNVNVANGSGALVQLYSFGDNITNTLGSITLFDSP
jgi:hypothetical protein